MSRKLHIESELSRLNKQLRDKGYPCSNFILDDVGDGPEICLENETDIFPFEHIKFLYKSMKPINDMLKNG